MVESMLGAVGEERAALVPEAAPPVDAWTAPEPLARRLLRAGKTWLFASVTFYSLMRLMGESDHLRGSLFMGFWAGTISFVGSRTGSLMPASPPLILGGVSVGGGLIVGATALAKGAPVGEAIGIASIGVFLGGILLWMGMRSRRAERDLAEGQQAERVAPVLISRAELATRLERIQEHNAKETPRLIRRVTIGGAVILGIAAFPYARVFGAEPPDIVGFGLLFGMWGAAGLLARTATRRAREVAERHGFICSACQKTYFGAFANHRYQKNIVEIGRCPQCGARIVTEDAP